MFKENLAFQVGDQVIHWVYGLGEVIQLDEKELSGQTNQYYVVQTSDLTLWVPIEESEEGRLRPPTPAKDFKRLFRILASPGDPLPADRYDRKTHLTGLLKDKKLESVCRVVRDLTCHKRVSKMNDSDNTLLDRARSFLIDEWSVALSVPVEQAERELNALLIAEESLL